MSLTQTNVFIGIRFQSVEDAEEVRERLLGSGVLDRFDLKTLPRDLSTAEAVEKELDTS